MPIISPWQVSRMQGVLAQGVLADPITVQVGVPGPGTNAAGKPIVVEVPTPLVGQLSPAPPDTEVLTPEGVRTTVTQRFRCTPPTALLVPGRLVTGPDGRRYRVLAQGTTPLETVAHLTEV